VIDKLIETYKGKVDKVFWNTCYKIIPAGTGSGACKSVNGWVLSFFPYNKNDYAAHLISLKEIYKSYE